MSKILSFLIAISSLSALFAQKQAVLVKDGKAIFNISIMENALKVDEEAALLMQASIRKMTGVELAIVRANVPPNKKTIWITSSSFFILPNGFKKHYSKDNELKLKNLQGADAFGISIQKDNILILGKSKKGTYYAVIHLLEKYLGCRMYAPNVEIIPKKTTVSLPLLCEIYKPLS